MSQLVTEQRLGFSTDEHEGTIILRASNVGVVIAFDYDGIEREVAMIEVPKSKDPLIMIWDTVLDCDDYLVAARFGTDGTTVDVNRPVVKDEGNKIQHKEYGNFCFKCGGAWVTHDGDGCCGDGEENELFDERENS